jgi:hypothetical protein
MNKTELLQAIETAVPPLRGKLHIERVLYKKAANKAYISFLCDEVAGEQVFLAVEKELKKLYVKEHDERQIQIWTAARAAATQTFLLVGLAAGTVAGYFSMTVSITILACVTAHSLIAMGFKIYYSTKF